MCIECGSSIGAVFGRMQKLTSVFPRFRFPVTGVDISAGFLTGSPLHHTPSTLRDQVHYHFLKFKLLTCRQRGSHKDIICDTDRRMCSSISDSTSRSEIEARCACIPPVDLVQRDSG